MRRSAPALSGANRLDDAPDAYQIAAVDGDHFDRFAGPQSLFFVGDRLKLYNAILH